MCHAALAGIAMDCRSKTRSKKRLICRGRNSIEAFGIAKFNEECRKIVLRYTEEWKEIVKRMGRWVDFNNTYRTMDLTFMETVWWVFKQLYEKGLVYEGYQGDALFREAGNASFQF